MSKIHQDEYGLYVVKDGSIVRPASDVPSLLQAGQTVKVKHFSGSPIFQVGEEIWGSVGSTKSSYGLYAKKSLQLYGIIEPPWGMPESKPLKEQSELYLRLFFKLGKSPFTSH